MQRKKPKSKTRSLSVNQIRNLTKLEEKQLLQRLSEGEMSAFWQLWQQHQKYLYHRCISWMGGNHTHAEEALSLAMLKALQQLPACAERITNLRAWLTRFTHNLCVDIHRERRRKAIGMESLEEIAVKEEEAVISSLDCPESAILRDELGQVIRDAVDALPSRLRTPFVLLYYHQVSYPDIAQQLALSQDNAYKRIQQARDILKKRLIRYLSGADNSVLASSETSCKKSNFVVVSSQSDSPVAMDSGCMIAAINYQLTATCLEKLSHASYCSPSHQGWR
ncbi:RNA polymerase sigma factor [Kamptonema formosum]|uniref:RNA polymerase sigma factor n=1 Tax=Kamptonema formosum TaxID=331992 RepID=UPI00034907DE|nr:RNA polymerase sigma factor [Oscillatoria sp. PCC 10802]